MLNVLIFSNSMVPPSTPQKQSGSSSSRVNKDDSVFISPVSTTKKKSFTLSSHKPSTRASPPCTPLLASSSFISSEASSSNSTKNVPYQIPSQTSHSMSMSLAELSFLSPEPTPASKPKNKRLASIVGSSIIEYDDVNTRALKKVKLLTTMGSGKKKSVPVVIRKTFKSSRKLSSQSNLDDDYDEEDVSSMNIDSDASTDIASDIEKDFFNDWDDASSSAFKLNVNSEKYNSLLTTPVLNRQLDSVFEDNVIPKGLPAARTLVGANNRRKNINSAKQFVVLDKQGAEIVRNYRSGINPSKNLLSKLSDCLKDSKEDDRTHSSQHQLDRKKYDDELEQILIKEAVLEDNDDDSSIEDELQNYFQRIKNRKSKRPLNVEDDETIIRNILKNDNGADSDENDYIKEEEIYLRKLLSKNRGSRSLKSVSPNNQGLNNKTGNPSNFGFTLSELSNMRNFKKISVFKDNDGQDEKKKK